MKWVDDWPVIGEDPDGDGKGEPVAKYRKPNAGREYPVQAPQTTDEFNSHDLKTKSVFLRVSMSDGICEFSYSTDGNNFSPAGEPFVAKPGVWIGAKVGLFSLGQGYAEYDWFRFAPHAQSAQTPARAQ